MGSRDAVIYAWWVVVVLTLAYITAFLDRQILSLLVQPIKKDLGISDVQIGLLQGLAFAIFFSTCVLPAGWMIDRFNRRNVLAVGLAMWCAMTVLCGLAQNYEQMFVARMGVGVGEAVLGPATLSLIGSYFDRKRIALAISVNAVGGSLGAGLAYIFGSLAERLANSGAAMIPGLSGLHPWQAAFVIVGFPGLLILVLVLTIREPKRGTAVAVTVRARRFILDRWQFFLFYCLGIGFLTTVSYANMAWIPTMYLRVHRWPTAYTAQWLGGMMLLFGTAGILAGGLGSIKLRAKYRDATFRIGCGIGLALAPLCAAAALVPDPYVGLGLYAVFTFISTSFVSLGPTSLLLVTPGHMLGRVSSVTTIPVTIIGVSLGPVFVAFLTDKLFADESKIAWSLGLGSGALALLAGIFLFLGLAHFREALDAAE